MAGTPGRAPAGRGLVAAAGGAATVVSMDNTNAAAAPPWVEEFVGDFPLAGIPAVGYWNTLTATERASFGPNRLAEACTYAERTMVLEQCLADQDVSLEEELLFLFSHLDAPHPERLVAWLT